MSEPLVCAGQWRRVMEAAGYQCQCTGACGNKHSKSGGRCRRRHGDCVSKHVGPIHLTAALTNPATPPVAAARLPLSALRVWCPACHDGARRAANRAARAEPNPGQGGLFPL